MKLRERVKEMDEYKKINIESDNYAFEGIIIEIPYVYSSKSKDEKDIRDVLKVDLKDLFIIFSTEMIGENVDEFHLETAIEKQLEFKGDRHIIPYGERAFLKKVLNQFEALGLIYQNYDKRRGKYEWGVTEKGKRIRDEQILIKRDE